MIALTLATVFNSGFAISIRFAQKRGANLTIVGISNYIVAFLLYTSLTIANGLHLPHWETFVIGGFGGVMFSGTFFLLYELMKQRGVSVTAAILGLSVLVPVGISLLAWGESATLPQTFGIVAAIVSLPLLSVGPTPASVAEKKKRVIHLVLLAGVFILNGLALVAARAFHQTGVKDEDTIFLFFIFTSATLTTCVVWAIQEIRRRNIPKLGGRETNNKGSVLWGVLFGIVAGLCNAFTNRFIIASLYKLPGIIVYPFYSAVGLLLTVVFSRLAWKEKIRGVEATGMAFAFVSIILMNFVS